MPTDRQDSKTESFHFTDGIKNPDTGRAYKFTFKEKLFVFDYLENGFIASSAAKAAGYNCTSEGSFRSIATAVMKKPHIKAAINAAFEALAMPKFEVIFRLGRIAAGDLTDVLTPTGEFDMEAARESGMSFLLKKVTIKRTRREVTRTEIDLPDDFAAGKPEYTESSILDEHITFEIHDPLKALELIGKHQNLFAPDRLEITGKDGAKLISDNPASVVVYLPDNGRGDAGVPLIKSKTIRTKGSAPETPETPANGKG